MRGFPKMGCLRASAELVSSDLVRPGLTLIQARRMLFQRGVEGLLSFVVAKS
jgi:hypothetical protein